MFEMASVWMCGGLGTCRFSWIQMGLYPVDLEIRVLGCWTASTLQEQCVYPNSPFAGNCRVTGGGFKLGMFSAPPVVSPLLQRLVYLWICVFTENLCCCIWMNWGSREDLAPLNREGNWEREVTHLRSEGLWETHSSALGDAGFYLWPSSPPMAVPALGTGVGYWP